MSKVLFRLYSNGDYAVLDEAGNPIERENSVVANGGSISVPLTLMDHEPALDPREAAWLKMCDRISSAWRQKGDPLPPEACDGARVASTDNMQPRPVFGDVSCGYGRPSATEHPAPDSRVAAAKARIARLAGQSA